MRNYKNIVFLLLLVLCTSIIVPLPAYASTSLGSSGQAGFLDTLVGLLANLFHIDLNQTNPLTQILSPRTTGVLPPGQKDVLGFYAEWSADDMASYNDLQQHIHSLGAIAPFWATLHGDGSVTNRGGRDHASVIKYAHNNHVTALLLVNNAKQNDPDSGIHAVLTNPSLRKTAIANLEAYIKKYNLDGINIDFEQVPQTDRDSLTAFMRELSARLKPQGYLVTIDVFPKHNEENDVANAYDYAQLAKYADRIMLMTYDYHAGWNGAGPIAGVHAVETDLKYALKFIPKNKVYLGIAGYGYDWSNNGVESVEYSAVQKLISRYGPNVQWDDSSESPHFSYTGSDGVYHRVWYENKESIKYKLDLVNKYDIAGIAVWKLGDEDPAAWQVIKDTLKR